MPARNPDPEMNRDDTLRPGRPPRPATEPRGAEGSSRNDKTMTDPATGEPQPGKPRPAGASQDDAPPDQAR